MKSILIILILAIIQSITTILIRDLNYQISFPIAFFVGWLMCLLYLFYTKKIIKNEKK
jgi:hypothetical protein